MLDRTSPTASPRHHPYRSPSSRSNSSASDHGAQLSYPPTTIEDALTQDSTSDQSDGDGIRVIVPIRMSPFKNDDVWSLWDNLAEARLQSDSNRCFELADKMRAIVTESDDFWAELLDHVEDVQRIASELADFRDHLSQKYDWLDVTLDELKNLSGEEVTAKTLDLFRAGDNIPSGSPHCFKDRQKFRTVLEHVTRSGTLSDQGELADTEGNENNDNDSVYSEDSAAERDFIREVNRQRRRSQDSQSCIYRRIESFDTKPPNLPQLKWEHNLHLLCEARVDCMVWACHAEFQGMFYANLPSPYQPMAYLHPNWTLVKNRWGYVPIGNQLDSPNEWSIGDIVYKPIPAFGIPGTLGRQLRFDLKTPFSYWVCTYDEDMPVKHQWKEIKIGGRHPLMCRFTLLHVAKQAPVWVYREQLSCDCIHEIYGSLVRGGVCLSCDEETSSIEENSPLDG
ncbi:hypothetical protein RhiJN_15082 [Ceratobasidium sp. AG-Ba]|nr:hypothetical protein RhiJN_15082 [Ceratobasidium sp. AG-Ba]